MKRDNVAERKKKIAKYGIFEVRRAEREALAKFRRENQMAPSRTYWEQPFRVTLANEGYRPREAQMLSEWLRGGWRDTPARKEFCKCKPGFMCELHYLNGLREIMEKGGNSRVIDSVRHI